MAKNLTPEQAAEIARQTEDAYSFDAYTPEGWRQCCLMLAKRGYDARQIEAVMRSKWTRWAGDNDSDRKRYGQYNSTTLARFIDEMIAKRGIRKVNAEIADLVVGTFGA